MSKGKLRRADVERKEHDIETAASVWLVRLSDGAHEADTQDEFEAWLAIDPRHGEAFDALSRTWEDVGSLKHLKPLADPDPVPILPLRWLGSFGGALTRPHFLSSGIVATAVAVAAAFAYLPALFDRPDAQFGTAIAELREVRLPDGSTVTLGAASEIQYRFTDAERRVTLTSGEAFFEVAHNPNRPFFVEAGDATVRVVGTKFDVHRAAGHVNVSVLEGLVQVSSAGDPDQRNAAAFRVLRAGERVQVEQRPIFFVRAALPSEVQPIRVAPAGAWREGRLSYDDARLGDLVADLNRYYGPGVTLTPAAQNLRVTTSFRTDEIPAFLDALSTVLPVEVEEHADRSFAVRERTRARN
jgi:transmembrane sensor